MFSSRFLSPNCTPWVCKTCRRLSTSARKKSSDRHKLPSSPSRTRFAPSPTGNLHLGSLRTALYNYLLAKATRGQFILRIEDTDSKRTVTGAEEGLYHDLRWAGLQWDEGPEVGGLYGPYRQSERTALYQDHARQLLRSDNAYRCFCSPSRLSDLAKRQNHYDGACRVLSDAEAQERAAKGEAHVIRLKTPDRPPVFEDLVYGRVGRQKLGSIGQATPGGLAFEDPILLKSDGLPTYHLANVVDDHHMKITHVIRATEWMSSTPKHLVIYNAFNWKPPRFVHVGLLQDSQQQKLSKRDLGEASLDLRTMQDTGIFPEALLNYVALHGWSVNRTSEVMNMEEMIGAFNLKFTKGNTVINPGKLEFFQKKYAEKYVHTQGTMFDNMVQRILDIAQQRLSTSSRASTEEGRSLCDRIASVLQHCGRHYKDPEKFYKAYFYFFRSLEPRDYFSDSGSSSGKLLAQRKNGEHQLGFIGKILPVTVEDTVNQYLDVFRDRLNGVSEQDWTAPKLQEAIQSMLSDVEPHAKMIDSEWKQKQLDFHLFLRWALMAGWPGPANSVAMEILGKAISLQRLTDASTLVPEDLDES